MLLCHVKITGIQKINNAWPLYLCLQFYLAATMNLLSVVAVMLISQISAAYSTQDI